MEQVCLRFESLLRNPNDSISRKELGNALRLLTARIDRYYQLTGHLPFGDIVLNRNLMHIKSDCEVIADWINKVNGEQQLSEGGIATFKDIGQEFLTSHREFCLKLLQATNEHENMSDIEVHNGFEKAKEIFRRFKEFYVNNWWWISKAAISGGIEGALTGGLSGGSVGGCMPIPMAVGAAVGFVRGSTIGIVSGTAFLFIGAMKYAIRKHRPKLL